MSAEFFKSRGLDPNNSSLSTAFAATNSAESRAAYDEWAQNYEKEILGMDYVLHEHTSTALVNALRNSGSVHSISDIKILDAGCGTGLVANRLTELGATNIDGIDYSTKMLEMAGKTGKYKDLEIADLSEPLAKKDGEYDAVTCSGIFTQGHVGPSCLREFARILKSGGFVAGTVLGDLWEKDGFKAIVDELVAAGKVELVPTDDIGVTNAVPNGYKMLVLKKL